MANKKQLTLEEVIAAENTLYAKNGYEKHVVIAFPKYENRLPVLAKWALKIVERYEPAFRILYVPAREKQKK